MWRDTAVCLLLVAVLALVLVAGCGKSEDTEQAQQQAQDPDASPVPPGMSGQMPDDYGQQAAQPAPQEPAEPEEVEPSGPSYRERYAQGELTAEELREEHELQKVERELGYPVGP